MEALEAKGWRFFLLFQILRCVERGGGAVHGAWGCGGRRGEAGKGGGGVVRLGRAREGTWEWDQSGFYAKQPASVPQRALHASMSTAPLKT